MSGISTMTKVRTGQALVTSEAAAEQTPKTAKRPDRSATLGESVS